MHFNLVLKRPFLLNELQSLPDSVPNPQHLSLNFIPENQPGLQIQPEAPYRGVFVCFNPVFYIFYGVCFQWRSQTILIMVTKTDVYFEVAQKLVSYSC